MPINPNNMLAPLNPIAPIQPLQFGGGGGGGSMERQRLQLLKQQFEETKRKNRVDEETDRLRMAGDMRQAELGIQKQKEQAAFLAAAELRKEQESAYADFYKATDARDFAGMSTAAERLRAHGGLAEKMGLEGDPRYLVAPSAAEYNKQEAARAQQAAPAAGPESSAQSLNRLSALGYDLANQNVVDAGELAETSRTQMGPVLRGYRGSLPPGAYQDSADSTIEGVQSLGLAPDKSVELLGKLRGLADPAIGKTLDIEQKQAEDAAKAAAAAVPKPLTEKQKQDVFDKGNGQAGELWKNRGLNNPLQARGAAKKAVRLLTNRKEGDSSNDRMIGFALVDMLGSRGPQSNSDINIALGMDALSVAEKAREAWTGLVHGGFSDERRKALIDVINSGMEEDDQRMYEFLDVAAKSLGNPENHPEYVRGWREFINSVPNDILVEWDAYRGRHNLPTLDELGHAQAAAEEETPAEPGEKPQRSGFTPTSASTSDDADDADDDPTSDDADDLTSEFERPPGTPGSALEGPPTAPGGAEEPPDLSGDFQTTLSTVFEQRGLDASKAMRVIGPESGGQQRAKNPHSSARGIIQMIDSTAREFVNPRTGKKFKDSSEFADLPRNEQVPVAADYFESKGLTADSPEEDYMLAVAAPAFVGKSTDRDAVVYPKGSDAHDINKPWWPEDGGDITVGDILDFYQGKRGSKKKAAPAVKPASKPLRDDFKLDEFLGGE